MHLTFRGVFLSLIQKHFPSTKRKREKGTGIKRKRKSSLTPSPAPASCPAAPATATQLLCLLPFSPLDAFCCFPAHLPLLPHPEDSSSGSSPLFLPLPHCPCCAPPSPRPTLGADGTRPGWCLSPSCSKGGPPQPLTQSMAGVLGKKNNFPAELFVVAAGKESFGISPPVGCGTGGRGGSSTGRLWSSLCELIHEPSHAAGARRGVPASKVSQNTSTFLCPAHSSGGNPLGFLPGAAGTA